MTTLARSWHPAFKAAASGAAVGWRRGVADAVARVARCHAAVFTCPPGATHLTRFDASSPLFSDLTAATISHYVPPLERTGKSWRYLVARHGNVYPVVETIEIDALIDSFRARQLAPRGLRSMMTAMMLTDGGDLVSWVVIGSAEPTSELEPRVRAGLEDLLAAARPRTLEALALAAEHGMIAPPPPTPELARLTRRQREIAELAADGFADLNIGARLHIDETTVGSHLRRIYRTLGVHTRVELAAKLGKV